MNLHRYPMQRIFMCVNASGTLRYAILGAVLLVAAFAFAQDATVDLTIEQVLEDFDAAWQIVGEGFYDPEHRGIDWEATKGEYRARLEESDDPQAAYSLITEMVAQLGSPTTSVIPPWEVAPADEPDEANDEGSAAQPLLEYGGVGILLSQTTAGEVLVLQVFRETPAEEAGALIGDIIVGVDDWRVAGEDAMEQVVSRVRGVVGTDVELTLRDPDGMERSIEITRAQIDLRPSVEARVLENGTGYIRVPALTGTLVDEASKSLPTLLSSRNLILDLRSVSVGELDAMATLAQWFLGSAQLGGFLTAGGAQALPFREDAIAAYQRTMTVLTNDSTSGVPEMLASILSSYRRAGLVGGQTAGGVELSQVAELPNGGIIGIALARYIAPDGTLAPTAGLEPDVGVELPDLATVREGRDVYIEAAIEAMQNSPRW